MWRDSGRPTKVGGADGRSVIALAIWFFHMKLWTFIVAALLLLGLGVLDRYGLTVEVMFRMLRGWLGGSLVTTASPYVEMVRFVTSKQTGGLR